MKKIQLVSVLLLLIVGSFLLWQSKQPIKIAFVGELSTSSSQLSIESREAFSYTINYYNDQGGIWGRKLAPYIYDDKSSNANKEALNQQLKKDGIHLIIGFNISAMAETIEYLLANGDYLIISPTVTTDYLTGKDDRFIKISAINSLQIDQLYEVVKLHDVKKMVIVYSESNKLFAEGLVEKMKSMLQMDSREVVAVIADSGSVNLTPIQTAINEHQADGLFVIMNGIDTAKVVQGTRISGYKGDILTSAWSATSDLITNSGKNSEGVYTLEMKANNPDEAVLKTLQEYIFENTGSDLNFSHIRTYNATKMLIEVLKTTKDFSPENMKRKIIEIGTFQGAETQFKVDSNGDTLGEYELQQIKNGKFVKVR